MDKSLSEHTLISKGETLLMNNRWYGVLAMILGILSFFTGEIVTFIMLCFILMALININTTLKTKYKNDLEQKEK